MMPFPVNQRRQLVEPPAEIGFDYCNQLFKLEEVYAGLDAEIWKAKRLESEPAIWEALLVMA